MGSELTSYRGFTFFLQDNTLAGLQNTLFSVFMLTTIFSTLVQQVWFSSSIKEDSLTCLDHASLRDATKSIRSPRAALSRIHLESVSPSQHNRRDPLPGSSRYHRMGLHILARVRPRTIPLATRPIRHIHSAVLSLRVDLCAHDHSRAPGRRDSRPHRDHNVQFDAHLQRSHAAP